MKTALVAGSTGLIGSQLVQLLLDNNRYDQVKAVTRTDLPLNHARLVQVKVDFRRLDDFKAELKADDVFCCLGTTMAKARSEKKFREVDYDYPMALANLSLAQGAKQFLLVSALGANKHSSIFYNQVKGQLEDAVTKLPFQAIHIFRPSLLLGPRTEHRSAEEAAKFFYKVFGFLIPAKYKAIGADKVAKAMVHFANHEERGIQIHESRDLQHF